MYGPEMMHGKKKMRVLYSTLSQEVEQHGGRAKIFILFWLAAMAGRVREL
jgi:hypothetical protein